ncbi:hypothetical protein, partial [Vibrio parahaemolyticus]
VSTGLASKVKSFGVYWFLFLTLRLNKCAFQVRSGGTRCVFFALISTFTVSNFLAISLARFLFCGWLFTLNSVLWCGCSSSVTESFSNFKTVKMGQFCTFFF